MELGNASQKSKVSITEYSVVDQKIIAMEFVRMCDHICLQAIVAMTTGNSRTNDGSPHLEFWLRAGLIDAPIRLELFVAVARVREGRVVVGRRAQIRQCRHDQRYRAGGSYAEPSF